jgi:beta-glucanase (GH16 family)
MYMLINLAVGGGWPGSPDKTTQFPAKYTIDWVRAYARRDAK